MLERMVDGGTVRDIVNEALRDWPLAATWLYADSLQPDKLQIAILPLRNIPTMQLLNVGLALRAKAGTAAFFTDLSTASAMLAEYVLERAVLIDDRDPVARETFTASLSSRQAERQNAIAGVQRALDELRYAR